MSTEKYGDERCLIKAIARGDRESFAIVYRRYTPKLGAFLWRLTRRQDLAEEALNDTMMVLWQKAHVFDGRASLRAWLFGIANKQALKAIARDRPHKGSACHARPMHQPLEETDLAGPDTGAVDAHRRDMRRTVAAALSALTPEHRSVIELVFFEGMSCAEAAEALDCPTNTVKTRMFHARKRLRDNATALGLGLVGGEDEHNEAE
ncbi:MAG: sigma-70 family RNA polymerase sigma factor [Pseudomonadota bacterium]